MIYLSSLTFPSKSLCMLSERQSKIYLAVSLNLYCFLLFALLHIHILRLLTTGSCRPDSKTCKCWPICRFKCTKSCGILWAIWKIQKFSINFEGSFICDVGNTKVLKKLTLLEIFTESILFSLSFSCSTGAIKDCCYSLFAGGNYFLLKLYYMHLLKKKGFSFNQAWVQNKLWRMVANMQIVSRAKIFQWCCYSSKVQKREH